MSPTYHQQPTLQNARIRTAQDALHVFFAVARNVLTLLTRRLDADERKAIRSGNVYIWEDRSASSTADNGGLTMERWYAPSPCFSRALYLVSQDRRNVMGSIAHTRGLPFRDIPPHRHTQGLTFFVLSQEFLFYYQRDPAQERLPSGGG
jgi:hypothetical protein